jgi:CRP-like cAMP-binding protein
MNPANLFDHDADALQLAPGDFLFREGDKRDNMYVLLEGEMDIRLVIMWSRQQGQVGSSA